MTTRQQRTKPQARVYVYPPETTSNESFANVFQSGEEKLPQRPTIAEIKRRVENIRRSKYGKTERDVTVPDLPIQTQMTITYGDIKEHLLVDLPKGITPLIQRTRTIR